MDSKKNDRFVVQITDIGDNGEGIGKTDEGYTLFVKDSIPGDKSEVKLIKKKKNYGYARLEKVLSPSPFRVEPPCPKHRQCGGCQLQALEYGEQLRFKHNKIRNSLIRVGGFEPELVDRVMKPIVGMETPYHYRNKAQYPFGTDREGRVVTGFYAGRTHVIIPNTNCLLGAEENEGILQIIINFMERYKISAYDETSGRGVVRHALVRTGFATGEIMVCLVINEKCLPHADKLVQELIRVRGMTSISVSVNRERSNVVMGKRIHVLWGREYIMDRIADIMFRISPLSFYQVNPAQTRKLYEIAAEYAGLTGKETVWDLYCGIGTISLFLAGRAKQVYGVEVVPEAVEDAKRNAALNRITNAEFFLGKAEEVLPAKYAEGRAKADVIVIDPPRKGCDSACLDTMLRMRPEKIVYVSCAPATLARDLAVLRGGGYELTSVQGVDQFGQTVHAETVCCLTRIK